LAALATVGAAQAQSSVTVYGVFDAAYNALSFDNLGGSSAAATNVKQTGIAGSGPLSSQRFGFRGTEDLGGGLRANFNLEYGFTNALVDGATTANLSTQSSATPASGATSVLSQNNQGIGGQLITRTSRVGLESAKLGRLDAGYGLTGLFATVTAHSPLPGNNFVGDVAYTSNATSSADSRILNSVTGYGGATRFTGVQYTSPTVNGIQAVVDYGSGKQSRDVDTVNFDNYRVSNAGLTLRYTAGKLALAATTHTYKADLDLAGNTQTTTDFQAYSARYAVTSNLAVNALYAKNKSKLSTTGLQNGKNDVTQVGASYTMGKNQLVAQYGEGEGEGQAGASRRDRKGYQVGAIHNLSKRTSVYALYGEQEAKYVDQASGLSSPSVAGPAGTKEKVSGYAVGLRHSF